MEHKPGIFRSYGDLGLALMLLGAAGTIVIEIVWPLLERCYYLGCI